MKLHICENISLLNIIEEIAFLLEEMSLDNAYGIYIADLNPR